jgi:hypothetical protein
VQILISVKRVTIGRDITDAQRNEIAASQLAVDREVEERQVAQAPLQMQPGTDRPYVPPVAMAVSGQ